MGKMTEYFSDGAYNRVSDADFQTVLRGVGFRRTPREVLTVGDMERYWAKRRLQGDIKYGTKEYI